MRPKTLVTPPPAAPAVWLTICMFVPSYAVITHWPAMMSPAARSTLERFLIVVAPNELKLIVAAPLFPVLALNQ